MPVHAHRNHSSPIYRIILAGVSESEAASYTLQLQNASWASMRQISRLSIPANRALRGQEAPSPDST